MKIPEGMLSLLAKKVTPNVTPATSAQTNPQTTPQVAPATANTGTNPEMGTQLRATEGAGEPAPATPGTSNQLVPAGTNQVAAEPAGNPDPSVAFRDALDRLDSLLAQDFDPVSLALSRGIVKRVMQELQTYPEFNGIVQDRDVRNVFVFLRRAVDQAQILGSEKSEKKEKRTRKEKAITIKLPDSLDMLGSLDVDAILGIKK